MILYVVYGKYDGDPTHILNKAFFNREEADKHVEKVFCEGEYDHVNWQMTNVNLNGKTIIDNIDISNILKSLYQAGVKIESEWNDDDGYMKEADDFGNKYNIKFEKEEVD